MEIKALIFDMDGLILDSEKIVQRAWTYVGEQLGYGDIGQHIYGLLGSNVVRRKAYFEETFGKDFPMDQFNKLTRAKFWEITEREGLDLKPGVLELMEYAKKRGMKRVVCTSSRREHATKVLTDAGVMKYLDGCIFGDMVEHAKPDPEIYRKAGEIAEIAPKNCLALEDAPAGIRSSYAAGMNPVVVPDLLEPTEEILKLCCFRADTLFDVIKFLEDQ